MSREEYAQYLRDQAQILQWIAAEVEAGKPALSEWMLEWTIRKEHDLLDAKEVYRAELEQAAAETNREVA